MASGVPTILDGPVGTELLRRGVELSGPAWSARAIEEAPGVLAQIHHEYALAGATIHTAATFRTQPGVLPDRWERLARRAVRIAREAVPRGHRIAGSIAPIADCYRPDLSPADAQPDAVREAHLALARVLVDAGCDILLCETFTHVGEAMLATEAAVQAAGASGAEVWTSFSPGHGDDLLSAPAMGDAGRLAAGLGAGAVLVNCAPVEATLPLVRALTAGVWGRGVAVGAYANAGRIGEAWRDTEADAAGYARAALGWVEAGARVVGSCCGTGPGFTKALTAALVA